MAAVEDQLAQAVAAGELRALSVDSVGRAVFALYAWEVRRWLAGNHPSLARGLIDLRALLDTVLGGFRVSDAGHIHPPVVYNRS